MKIFKRITSSMLALVMVFTTFCFADLGLRAAAEVDPAPVETFGRPQMNFFVPETVYLDQSGKYQYFVDSNAAGELNRNPAKTTGQVTFSSTIAFEDLLITRSDSNATYGTNIKSTAYNVEIPSGVDTGTDGGIITWTATYTVDGVGYESHAYTYLYQPFTGLIGSGFKGTTSEVATFHLGEHMEINVLTGFHSYNDAKGGYKWGGSNTGVLTPWEIPIGTDRSNPTAYYGGEGPSRDETKFLTASSTNNYFAFADYGKHSDIEETQDINTVSAGNLAVDVSRYSNTDQIPNLQVAAYTTYMVYSEPSDTNFETAANQSTSEYPSDSAFVRYYDTADFKSNGGDSESRYASARVSSAIPPANSGISMPVANGTKSYQLWIKQYVYHKYAGTLDSQFFRVNDFTRLNVTMVDKGALRELYRECSGLGIEQTNNYGTAYQTDFLTALKAAATALGRPTATDVQTAYSNLSTALSSLRLPEIESGFNTPNFTFYVPETIYLKPGDLKTFEYYVDSNTAGALNTAQNKTGGLVYFNCPEATSVNITYSGATVNANALTGQTTTVNTSITGGTAPSALAQNGTATITWTASFVVDGMNYEAKTYTVMYAPMTTVTAAAVRVRNTHGWGGGNQNYMQSLMYAFGFHSYTANGAYDTVSPLDDIFSARRTRLTKADGNAINNNSAGDWLSGTNVTKKNAAYDSEVSASGNNGTTSKTVTGPDAAITIDTSRYTNFNQIPNLSAGWAATDDQNSTSQTATVTCTYGTGKVTTMHDIPWQNGNPEDDPLDPTQITGAIADNNTNKLELYGYACSKDEDWDDTGDKAENKLYLTINVNKVNKASLRANYRKAIMSGRCEAWYTSTTWSDYQAKIKTAGEVLGNPLKTASEISTANDQLIQSTAALEFRPGEAEEIHVSTQQQKELSKTTTDYHYGDTISAYHNEYDGYTYKGYETSNELAPTVVTRMDGTDPASLPLFTGSYVNYTFYYEPKTYTITYDPAGGTFNNTTGVTTDTATYDANYLVGMANTETPSKAGFHFDRWQVSGESDTQTNGSTIVWNYTEDKTFTALWTENQYTLIYHTNGGTGTDYTCPNKVLYSQTILTEANGANIGAALTGYTFRGWRTKPEGEATTVNAGSPISVMTIVADQEKAYSNNATIYLYANWSANIYTLHYDANAGGAAISGTFPSDRQCKASDTVVVDPANAFSWPGHAFQQWNTKADGTGTPYNQGGEYGALSQTHGDTVTLYAIWETLYYDVTFEEDYGSAVDDLTHQTYNTTMTFPTSTKAGYKDLKWYEDQTFHGTGYAPGATKKITASVTYYAKWTIETYTLSYDLAGGSLDDSNPATYTIETTTFTLNNPTQTGYVFDGWTGTGISSPQMSVVIGKGSTGNRSYTANWHLDEYTITYILDGGSMPEGVSNPATYNYESATITLNAPVKPGWTFQGWKASQNGAAQPVVVIQHNSTGNRTYTAVWLSNTYYVDYLPAPSGAQVDNMPSRQTLLYKDASAIVSDIIPIRAGYDFVCWNTKADGTGTNYSGGDTLNETKPTANGGIINLYPRWTPSAFTVKWNLAGGTLNGNSTVADTTVTYLGNYTVPKGTFFKSSYRIVDNGDGTGWFDAETGGNAITDSTQVTSTSKIQNMYAHWENAEYTVAFDANGGQGTMNSILATCNVPFRLPNVGFTRPGYNFGGWATTQNGAFVYGDGDNVTTNMTDRDGATVTLYARWEGRPFKIAYNLNGGSGTLMASNVTMANADGVGLRDYYAKLGTQTINGSQYEFYGWAYTKAAADAMTRAYENKAPFILNDNVLTHCTVDWTAATPTITLYAIWARHTTVTWKLEGGMLDGNKDDVTTEVIYGQNYVLPTGTYARSRFQFVEWRTLPQGGGTRVDGDTTLLTNDDTTVYAFWAQTNPDLYTNYTTEYYHQDPETGLYPAEPYESIVTRALVDSEVNAVQKTYEGFTLDADAPNVTYGLVLDNEESDEHGQPKMLVLKLYYKPNTHVLSFNANSGTGLMDDITFKYSEVFHLPANTFQKLGYSFGGWLKSANAASIAYGDENEFTGPNADVELFAKWTMDVYTITTNPTGGTLAAANPESYTVETETITLNNPTRRGYTFAGWTGSNGTTPQTTVTIPKGSTGNKTYAAVWDTDVYAITCDLAGGTLIEANPENYTVETETITLNNPGKTGYTFDGWTGSNGEVPQQNVLILQGSIGDRHYTANWTAETYTISCALKGGTLATPNPESYTIEDNDITLNNPTRTGYIFQGWTGSNDTTPQTTVTIAKGSTGNKSYTANWTAITYSVAFNGNGGTGSMSTVTGVAYDAEITLPDSAFTREGYTFLGWAAAADAEEYEYRKNQKVSGLTAENGATVTLYAFWSVNSYTISFDSAGGSPVASITLPYGQTVTAPTDPSREGYTFDGWTPELPPTMPAGNLTVTATWHPNAITVTFNRGGAEEGTDMADITVSYGEEKALPKCTFEKTGYHFGGWARTAGGPAAIADENTIVGGVNNVELFATWIANKYYVQFLANGATNGSMATLEYVYDKSYTLPDNAFTKTGARFLGWAMSANGEVVYDETNRTVTNLTAAEGGTVALYAIWENITYIVTFDGNGATTTDKIPAPVNAIYNEKITLPAAEGMLIYSDTASESRSFLGWVTEDNTSYAAGAQFTVPAENVTLKAVWSANYYALDQLIAQIANYRTSGVLPANGNDAQYASGGEMARLLGSSGTYAWNNFNTADLEAAFAEANRDSNRNLPQAQQSKVDTLTAGLQTALDSITLKDVNLDERYICGYTGEGFIDEVTGKVYPLCEEDEMHSYNSLLAIIDRILTAEDSDNLYTADSVEELRVAIYGDASTEGIAVEVANTALKAPAQIYLEDYVNRMAEAYHTHLVLKDADYTNLDALISAYLPSLNGVEYGSLESFYQADSVANLKAYYESINRDYKNINQSLIDIGGDIYVELKSYIDALVPGDADYTDVFYQILNIPTGTPGFSYPAPNVIRSTYSTWINWARTNAGAVSAQMDTAFLNVMYTESSVSALNRVLDGINWNRNIFAQDAVNGAENPTSYAKLVQNAREALTARTYSVTYMVNDGTDAVYTVVRGYEYATRIESFPPSVPARDKFVFKGWSSDPDSLVAVNAEDRVYSDMVVYAIWGSVYDEVIELVAGEGSTTVIDKDRRYIYGLKPQMTKAELEETFLNVIGNGRLVIENSGSIGTGTIVKLVSNYTDDVLETYELVIFGDVNGDGMINSTDVSEVRMMNARLKSSAFNNPYTFAADVMPDGNISAADVTMLRMMSAKMATIDQATRERVD